MAKKRKPAKGGKKSDAVKSSEVMKMPPASAVRSLAGEITETLGRTKRITDGLAKKIGDAKKSKGIHPGALKRVERLVAKAKKTDRGLTAVATEMAHFHYYCDVLGLDKLLEQQGQMFPRTEAGESGGAGGGVETEAPDSTNVVTMPAAAGAKAHRRP